MRAKYIIAAAALALLTSPALAYDWVVTVPVNAVEMTGSPGKVTFWIDYPASSCVQAQGLGAQIYWTARGSTPDEVIANGQAALATLLTARASGRPVKLFGRTSDCQVEFMYLN